jgi:uncharacterized membrane protein YsdA (DUF1294 family)
MTDIYYGILLWAAWNGWVFFLYGSDKKRSIEGKWRISERTLLLAAFAGGAAGAWLGMKHFHHKTKHKKFTVLVPVFLILQGMGLFLWLTRSLSYL